MEWALRTPRRAAARIALHAGAVSQQSEVAALAAGFAFVAFGLGFGAFLGRRGLRIGLGPLQLLERLRRREFLLGLGLERGRAGDFRAGRVGAERSDVRPRRPLTPALSRKGRRSR
jgi:hypothetical protein